MEKRYLLIILILSVIISVFANDPIAVIIKTKGELKLIRNSKETAATSGEALFNGDIVKSGKKSYAAIKFSDASSIVKLFPNSEITITAKKQKDKYNKNISLKIGNIWSKVTKKTGKFDVETPTTVVSVKGTEFLVNFDPEQKITDVMTFRGVVLVKNKFDKFIKEVHPGEKSRSKGTGIINLKKFNESDLNKNILNFIKEDKNIFEFDMHNGAGETRHIRMDFE